MPNEILLKSGTAIQFASSGGDYAITLASLANNAARQAVKADFGATRARRMCVGVQFELAATPTAGNVIEVRIAWSPTATAGSDNSAGTSGTDAAYSGYSSNLDASLRQTTLAGLLVCTAQATAIVQKDFHCGTFIPLQRYGNLIVYNKSGAAFHSSDTNCKIIVYPAPDEVQ